MDCKSRKFEPDKGVVNTLLCVTEPRVPLRDGESACWDEVHRTEPVACRPIVKCGIMGCTGSCPLSVVEFGYTVGNEPATCETCGKNSRVQKSLSQIPRLSKVKG